MTGKRLVVVLCMVVCAAACTGAEEASSDLPPFTSPPSAAPETAASEASDTDRIATAYRAYTAAVSEALATGDADLPALERVATGQALKDARARVAANAEDGVVTTGALEPSATAAEVTWTGGDRASVTDCVLNGLAHVEADDQDAVVTEADGTRRPVEADLRWASDGWVVARVEMPQDPDSDNPQKDPPFLRGPMPDGPPSCAPPELERELLERYQAFWDAFDRAFGFGRDGPANPDDPALAQTSVDPQLTNTRRFLRDLRRDNQSGTGEPDQHDPWVLAVTQFDKRAVLADCVEIGRSSITDLDTGRVVSTSNSGQLDYYTAEMRLEAGGWLVESWDIDAEGIRECESPKN